MADAYMISVIKIHNFNDVYGECVCRFYAQDILLYICLVKKKYFIQNKILFIKTA